jgi:hypothetical protein
MATTGFAAALLAVSVITLTALAQQPATASTTVIDQLVPANGEAVLANRMCFRERRVHGDFGPDVAFHDVLKLPKQERAKYGFKRELKNLTGGGSSPYIVDMLPLRRNPDGTISEGSLNVTPGNLFPCGQKSWSDVGIRKAKHPTQICRGTLYLFAYRLDLKPRGSSEPWRINPPGPPPDALLLCDGELYDLPDYVKAVVSGERIVTEITALEATLKSSLTADMAKTAEAAFLQREKDLAERVTAEVIRRLSATQTDPAKKSAK